eukprot:TRINITY_DN8093_c1_g1_i1.p1 TRINITY_DN8093_c1_g1~~TRINITY_DN8093_c1_g1_i1.p1  ORF type:complete len:132 (+),score=8.51 TRINITY_DN8093_c1_g1_i1:45-440(+)
MRRGKRSIATTSAPNAAFVACNDADWGKITPSHLRWSFLKPEIVAINISRAAIEGPVCHPVGDNCKEQKEGGYDKETELGVCIRGCLLCEAPPFTRGLLPWEQHKSFSSLDFVGAGKVTSWSCATWLARRL